MTAGRYLLLYAGTCCAGDAYLKLFGEYAFRCSSGQWLALLLIRYSGLEVSYTEVAHHAAILICKYAAAITNMS